MTSPIRKTMWRNTSLKIISVLLGYTFWYVCSYSHVSTAWITVPLCFYNVPQHMMIKAPETIALKIMGKRSALCSLDIDQLAIHINAAYLNNGTNPIAITEQSLFLPESIKLVHYSPSNMTIELAPVIQSVD